MRPLLTVLAIFVLLFAPRLSAAAPKGDEKAQARALLVEGGGLLQSGEYAEALARFEKAFALVPSPKIQYNLGLAYMGLGRPADALQAFELFVASPTDASAANVALAKKYIAQLPKKVGVVELEGETAGAETSIDGRSYAAATRIFVNPGPHQITVDKPGQSPFLQKIVVAAGDRLLIAVRFDRGEAGRAAIAPPPPPPVTSTTAPEVPQPHAVEADRSADHAPSSMRTLAYVGFGVTGALLGGSIAALLMSNHQFDLFNDLKNADGSPTCNLKLPDLGGAKCREYHDSGNRWRTITIVAGVGAGVAAVGSVYLFLRSSPGSREDSRIACAPTIGTLGGVCRLSF